MFELTKEKKLVLGHVLACGTQIMWGATFVATKVLVKYLLPVEVLFIRVWLAVICMFIVYPHHLKVEERKRELVFAGAGFFGIVLYFMLENTALTMTYASNIGIIVACAPFFVAIMMALFFKNEKPGVKFFIGFVVAMTGIVMISLNGSASLDLNPMGNILAVLAMASWGMYSVIIKVIGEWDYPVVATTRRIYFYALIFLIPVLVWQKASWNVKWSEHPEVIGNLLFLGICASAGGFMVWNLCTKWIGAIKTSIYIYVSPVVTLVLSVIILHEKLTIISGVGVVLILTGLLISQKDKTSE